MVGVSREENKGRVEHSHLTALKNITLCIFLMLFL